MSKTLPRTSRVLVPLACGILSLGAPACGGGGKNNNYPDASTLGTGGTTGAAGGAAGAGATSSGGHPGTAGGGTGGSLFPGTGGTGAPIGGASGTPGTPPAPGSTLLLGGTAILMGPGVTCSAAPPAQDQWCGIFAPSGNNNIGLLVFNVTKALAGTPVCTGTADPNCLALTPAIDTQDSNAVYSFFGQTLIYSDASTIYAWRPGWTAGRALVGHTTSRSVRCEGNLDDVPTAICLSDANEFYAGPIGTQAGSPLPLIDTLTNGSSGIGFSPDGLSIIWSSAISASGPAENLMMETLGDPTTKKTIAANVTEWTISPDLMRWYWLSAPSIDANKVITGTLQMAPYPAGTPPVALQSKVGQFAPFGTKSLITLTPSLANPVLNDIDAIADVENAAASTTVAETGDAAQALALTDTGSILYATKVVQPNPMSTNKLYDLRVVRTDGTGKCTVDATASADASASFNRGGTAVEWVQVTVDGSGTTTAISGQFTTLADCGAHVFSSGLLYNFFDLPSGLLVQQDLDSKAYTADVGYAAFGATGVPGTLVTVQARADAVIAPLFPAPGRVLFSLNSGSATDGIYVSAAIPSPTPELAPVRRPVTAITSSRGLSVTTLARARFGSTNRASIPSVIAAPARRSLPVATRPSSPSFAPLLGRGRGTAPSLLFRPLSRSSLSR